MKPFTTEQLAQFNRNGYLVVPGLATRSECARMIALARDHLARAVAPVEYEADVGYPGAPASKEAPGGRTIRRLLQACARDPVFAAWATDPRVVARVQQLFARPVVFPQAHHNCVMTKQPGFSSETHWHQDIRYWSYARPELVSVWLALGEETAENGCLMLLPGTQSMEFDPARLDAALFLRPELPANQALIATRVLAPLAAGDVLFFHARTFHAAGRNSTHETKFSVVTTYRPNDNPPRPDSRSSVHKEIALDWLT
jgi:phytanoyl-CoA hydroxylase